VCKCASVRVSVGSRAKKSTTITPSPSVPSPSRARETPDDFESRSDSGAPCVSPIGKCPLRCHAARVGLESRASTKMDGALVVALEVVDRGDLVEVESRGAVRGHPSVQPLLAVVLWLDGNAARVFFVTRVEGFRIDRLREIELQAKPPIRRLPTATRTAQSVQPGLLCIACANRRHTGRACSANCVSDLCSVRRSSAREVQRGAINSSG
jgi:hypothetical protein